MMDTEAFTSELEALEAAAADDVTDELQVRFHRLASEFALGVAHRLTEFTRVQRLHVADRIRRVRRLMFPDIEVPRRENAQGLAPRKRRSRRRNLQLNLP
jgi:hypothetical protein